MIETCEMGMCGEVAIYISPSGLFMCNYCKQKDMNITCNSPGDYKSIDVVEEIIVGKNATKCLWVRAFDNHFNISCTNKTNERANGNFKGKPEGAKWEFIFCPYCGKEISL